MSFGLCRGNSGNMQFVCDGPGDERRGDDRFGMGSMGGVGEFESDRGFSEDMNDHGMGFNYRSGLSLRNDYRMGANRLNRDNPRNDCGLSFNDSGIDFSTRKDSHSLMGFNTRNDSGMGFNTRSDSGFGFNTRNNVDMVFNTRNDSGMGFNARNDSGMGFNARSDSGMDFNARNDSGINYNEMRHDYGMGHKGDRNNYGITSNNDAEEYFAHPSNFNGPFGRRRLYDETYDAMEQPKKKKRKKRLREPVEDEEEEGEVKCDVCEIMLESRKAYKEHALCDTHINILEKRLMEKYMEGRRQKNGKTGETSDTAVTVITHMGTWCPDQLRCIVCEIEFESYKDYVVHAQGTYHKVTVRQVSGEELTAMCLMDESKKPWGREEQLQIQTNFSREQGDYNCSICDVQCTGDQNMADHLKGSKHRKKLQKLSMTDENFQKATADLTGIKIGYQALLDETTEPLIGVEYIFRYKGFEFERNNFEFSCFICDCPLSFVNLLSHLTGWKHRRKYIKYTRPELYESVLLETNVNKKEANDKARDIAADIEAEFGRQKPRYRIFIPPEEAKRIMEFEHDRCLVNYREHYWEEVHDGRQPPKSRDRLEADFDHWKKMTGTKLPYEKDITCLEPDEASYLLQVQARGQNLSRIGNMVDQSRTIGNMGNLGRRGNMMDQSRIGNTGNLGRMGMLDDYSRLGSGRVGHNLGRMENLDDGSYGPRRMGDFADRLSGSYPSSGRGLNDDFDGPGRMVGPPQGGYHVGSAQIQHVGRIRPLMGDSTPGLKDPFYRPDPSFYDDRRRTQQPGYDRSGYIKPNSAKFPDAVKWPSNSDVY